MEWIEHGFDKNNSRRMTFKAVGDKDYEGIVCLARYEEGEVTESIVFQAFFEDGCLYTVMLEQDIYIPADYLICTYIHGWPMVGQVVEHIDATSSTVRKRIFAGSMLTSRWQ